VAGALQRPRRLDPKPIASSLRPLEFALGRCTRTPSIARRVFRAFVLPAKPSCTRRHPSCNGLNCSQHLQKNRLWARYPYRMLSILVDHGPERGARFRSVDLRQNPAALEASRNRPSAHHDVVWAHSPLPTPQPIARAASTIVRLNKDLLSVDGTHLWPCPWFASNVPPERLQGRKTLPRMCSIQEVPPQVRVLFNGGG
jgi:hypothetical protein